MSKGGAVCACRRGLLLLPLLADDGDTDVGANEYVALMSGETVRAGETGRLADGAASAHAALDSEKYVPVAGTHELFPEVIPSLLPSSSGVDDVRGLAVDEGAFAMTESGGRIENI